MSAEQMIDDTTLSAWLDGALECDEFNVVEAALERSPELQQRLNALLLNERSIKNHFWQMAAERPVPQATLALLGSRSEPSRKSLLQTVMDWLNESNLAPGVIAAGFVGAIVVGVLVGQQGLFGSGYWQSAKPGSLARIDAEHDWFPLLESTGSGEQRALAGQQMGLVALSYQNGEGAWCRQFKVLGMDQTEGTAAIACRQEGQWQIELAQRLQQQAVDHGLFEAASATEHAALDAYIAQHSEGDVIVGELESALINRGWQ